MEAGRSALAGLATSTRSLQAEHGALAADVGALQAEQQRRAQSQREGQREGERELLHVQAALSEAVSAQGEEEARLEEARAELRRLADHSQLRHAGPLFCPLLSVAVGWSPA